jgi:periplasmic divalent cation tolerance protein
MNNIQFLYTTFSNRDDAKSVIITLINEKLIACANISNIESIFYWKDKMCYQDEVSVIIKTTSALLSEVIARLESLHQYAIPCIANISLDGINQSFAKWVQDSVRSSSM